MLFFEIPEAIRKKVSETNFEIVTYERDGEQATSEYVFDEVKNWITKEKKSYPWLILHGNPGTGKTTLAVKLALAYEYKHKVRACFVKQAQLDLYLAGMDPNERVSVIEELAGVPFLIFDDFGVGQFSALSTVMLYQLFDDRYINRRLTIVTTNLEIVRYSEGVSHLSRRDMYFELILDRMLELGYFVYFDFPSFRGLRFRQKKRTMAIKDFALEIGMKE